MDFHVYVLGTITPQRRLTYVGWTNDIAQAAWRAQCRQGRALDARADVGAAAFGKFREQNTKP